MGMNYLKTVAEAGVKNMEMEALVFGALTHMAGIRSAVVCVTLLDRLKGDQITTPRGVDVVADETNGGGSKVHPVPAECLGQERLHAGHHQAGQSQLQTLRSIPVLL